MGAALLQHISAALGGRKDLINRAVVWSHIGRPWRLDSEVAETEFAAQDWQNTLAMFFDEGTASIPQLDSMDVDVMPAVADSSLADASGETIESPGLSDTFIVLPADLKKLALERGCDHGQYGGLEASRLDDAEGTLLAKEDYVKNYFVAFLRLADTGNIWFDWKLLGDDRRQEKETLELMMSIAFDTHGALASARTNSRRVRSFAPRVARVRHSREVEALLIEAVLLERHDFLISCHRYVLLEVGCGQFVPPPLLRSGALPAARVFGVVFAFSNYIFLAS